MEIVFNIGDKVRIISSNNNSQNCVGEQGFITEIDKINYKTNLIWFRVKVHGRSNIANWHEKGEVELIESKF